MQQEESDEHVVFVMPQSSGAAGMLSEVSLPSVSGAGT
jgi:hypothetical protein